MTTLSIEHTRLKGLAERRLKRIFGPVSADLRAVDECLNRTLRSPRDAVVREIVSSLLQTPGKRMRPALVLLASRAASGEQNGHSVSKRASVVIATAMELLHMASLVHDDFIDAASVRHHRSSVNAKWGAGVSVALGDYLCASAFQFIAQCEDPLIFSDVGLGLCAMCEGEMLQVIDRGNFALTERDCLAVVEKKTAALFAACCAAGAAVVADQTPIREHLYQFGLHIGIAFQILDDCKDLLSDQGTLGKQPAQDLLAGDVTLPLLLLLEHTGRDGEERMRLSSGVVDAEFLDWVKRAFHSSEAGAKTEQVIRSHTDRAKRELRQVADSDSKESLRLLADHIAESISEILAR